MRIFHQPEPLGEILRKGGVVILPTDTIYGLSAVATNDAAVARIAELKGRGDDKPFVVIAATADQLRGYGAEVPAALDSLWPAPLTAIMHLGARTSGPPSPDIRSGDFLAHDGRLTGGQPTADQWSARHQTTVAARVPALAWLRTLLESTGPLVSTSVNRSGEPPISAIDEVAKDMVGGIDAALDAGRLDGKPSTIVDFTGEQPRIVREGDPTFAQNLRKSLRISL